MSNLGIDVDDAAVPPGLHSGQHRAAEQHRALDEEVQLGEVVGPGHIDHRGFGLRAGGVEDQHINRAETVSDRGDQPGNLVLIGDVRAKAPSGAAIVTDAAADLSYLLIAGPSIDRDGNAITGQAPRDHSPQAPRAARHQSDTPMRHCHLAIIPLRSAHKAGLQRRAGQSETTGIGLRTRRGGFGEITRSKGEARFERLPVGPPSAALSHQRGGGCRSPVTVRSAGTRPRPGVTG
jgi:hypothetical protein